MDEAHQVRLLSASNLSPGVWRTYLRDCHDEAILENAQRALQAAGFVLTSVVFLSDISKEAKEQVQAYFDYWIAPTIQTLEQRMKI